MSQGTTSRRRSTRQLQTCHQCRVRKVRCDGGPSACANCERLKFACSFARPRPRPGPEAEPPASSPGGREEPSSSDLVDPGRRRATRACAECRVQKTKCSGEAPSCASCVRRGRPCAYPESKRPLRIAATKPANDEGEQSSSSPSLGGRRSSVPVLPPDTAETCASVVCSLPSHTVESVACGGLPTIDQTLSLLRGFFRHIYPLVTYSFLHEPSVTQRCLQGTLEEALAYTICSIAAMRLRQGDFSPQVTDQWVERAEARIWEQIEHPTIFRLQALVLAIHYRMLTGRFQRAFMLSSLAARSASALRLNYEREDLSFLAQEIRRRLMWTLMYLDCYFSFGLPEFELCPYEVIYLSLPAREEDFNDETAELGEPHLGSRGRSVESGLYAFDIRIMTVRRDIMRLKRQVALSEQPMPQLAGLVEDFRKILLQIRSETPGSRLHALGEMEKVYASRWRQRYLIAHLSWHQCNCDLYRLFLRGYQEAAPEVVLQAVDLTYTSTAASLCLEHATAIIQIIYDFDRRSSDDDVVECVPTH
ncbi:hypothetical protein GGR56DRAFT_621837 [Xylariaceae sp. FL0804]|nr:hypothetical protein GGR56DRAFT_621837 [Xylariaceae sp. FL0804]